MAAPRITKNKNLVPLLLAWFAANARDLPWRRNRDPYAIWVSEIMLQQTQVKTVIPYWERWMRELPTIRALAKASPAKIHKLWEGLGYYTRVRNLQKAAQQIIATEKSKSTTRDQAATSIPSPGLKATLSPSDAERDAVRGFPTNFDAVLALPGIGRYTAGAICSIAFNQPTPILDGNVIRVLTRVYGIRTDPREKQTNARLWQLAEESVKAASDQESSATHKTHQKFHPLPEERAGVRAVVYTKSQNACSHLNQSLMELGALICTPRSPNCTACPVQKLCFARKEDLQDQIPNLGKRVAITERRFQAFLVEHAGKFLVRQRPAGVVNAHLWEFPNAEIGARVCDPQQLETRRTHPHNCDSSHTEALRVTEPRSVASRPSGFHLTATKPLCTIKHSITRYRITLEAWQAELATPSAKTLGRWLALNQLHRLAFTSAHKKILTHLGTLSPASTRRNGHP